MSSIDHLLSTSYRYGIMGPRTCPAKEQLLTRIRNDNVHREYEKLIGSELSVRINNIWRANDLPTLYKRKIREDKEMKREIEAAKKAALRLRRAALRSLFEKESAKYDKELRIYHSKAFYVRRQ